jgi:hypothetical protein
VKQAVPYDEVDSRKERRIMSALIVSSLMATAFAAVPPWFGSEPYVFFSGEDAAPRAEIQVAPSRPTLAKSLGSEPSPGGLETAPPERGERIVARQEAPTSLATSLGSEPFFFGDTGGAAAVTARKDATASKVARSGGGK